MPSESTVSFARGGFGGLTVSGEVAFLEPGDDGDCARSASAVHVLHQWSLVLNVTLSPGSNFRLQHSNTALLTDLFIQRNENISCSARIKSPMQRQWKL